MFELMDEMSELVYVADLDTYELLFVNKEGRKMFGISELNGQKCYKALQGLDHPCPFCTNKSLAFDKTYSWEYTNPIAGRHYLLKDKLVKWEGRSVRLEIAFDITNNKQEQIDLQNALDAEHMVMECVKFLSESANVGKSFPLVLQKLGSFLSAERAYIFNIRGDKMDNTYEWCADGIEPQKENLQGLDITLIDRWRPFFEKANASLSRIWRRLRKSTLRNTRPFPYRGFIVWLWRRLKRTASLLGISA